MPLFADRFQQAIIMKRTLLLLTILSSFSVAYGQNEYIGLGFRTGLSFSKFDGPSETGPNGEELESFSSNGGFLIGGLVNFKFTDLVGLRTEFTYSQRGTKYKYEGPSYYQLNKGLINPLTLIGTRSQSVSVKNTYIDIPLLAYYKIGKIELHGGINAGLLVSSTGGGNISFTSTSPVAVSFDVNLDHNYKADEAGGASTTVNKVNIGGTSYDIPTFLGAYYDFETKDKDQYKTLDFGLAAGISYFINSGLFLSFRYVHGLGDVDRNDYDISLQSLGSGNAYIRRADKNTSTSMQFSLGFSF